MIFHHQVQRDGILATATSAVWRRILRSSSPRSVESSVGYQRDSVGCFLERTAWLQGWSELPCARGGYGNRMVLPREPHAPAQGYGADEGGLGYQKVRVPHGEPNETA